METTYFGIFLLISFKIPTFLLLLSSNIGKVAELWCGLLYVPRGPNQTCRRLLQHTWLLLLCSAMRSRIFPSQQEAQDQQPATYTEGGYTGDLRLIPKHPRRLEGRGRQLRCDDRGSTIHLYIFHFHV